MDEELEQFDDCSVIYDFYYCTECGCEKLCLDRERDEIYCSRCGLVLDDDEIELIKKARDMGRKIIRNAGLASQIGKRS